MNIRHQLALQLFQQNDFHIKIIKNQSYETSNIYNHTTVFKQYLLPK